MALATHDKGDLLRLRKIDEAISQVCHQMNFLSLTPNNLDAEKEKVFADSSYDPQFTYEPHLIDVDVLKSSLESIDRHDSFIGSMLETKRKDLITKCGMLVSRGTTQFGTASAKTYGLPSKELVEKALALLDTPCHRTEKTIPTKKAIDLLKAEITHYGFDYRVEAKEMSSSAAVLIGQQKIVLKRNHDFPSEYIQQLIFHEIGTHVLRAENGRRQPLKIFVHGFPGYLPTEEGLAVVNEERFGLLPAERMKRYAARTIAVHMAKTDRFSEIYNKLLSHFEEKDAFIIALRAKRGLEDTSKPGGNCKDYYYLEGYHKVKDYLDAGGKIKDLYYGKIGVDHVNDILKMQGIERPRYLPENQRFKSLISFLR